MEQTEKIIRNVNKQLLETKQRQIMTDVIDLDKSEQAEFKVVNRKRKTKNLKIGTAEVVESDECSQLFQARNYKKPEERKLWLFISRTKSSVDEITVKNYIAKKGNQKVDDISVKLLKTKSEIKDNNCFMVGVPLQMKESIYDSGFWPKGVQFQRFDFKIGQHFLSAGTSTQTIT